MSVTVLARAVLSRATRSTVAPPIVAPWLSRTTPEMVRLNPQKAVRKKNENEQRRLRMRHFPRMPLRVGGKDESVHPPPSPEAGPGFAQGRSPDSVDRRNRRPSHPFRTVADSPALPTYSGGTVRDSHPLPFSLALHGEHLKPIANVPQATFAVNNKNPPFRAGRARWA